MPDFKEFLEIAVYLVLLVAGVYMVKYIAEHSGDWWGW